MSLAHQTIKNIPIQRAEHDPEVIDILRGLESHDWYKRMRVVAKSLDPAVEALMMAGAIQGFLLGQAFEQANSLEKLVKPEPRHDCGGIFERCE